MQYLKKFLSLKCAGDVLNATHPVGNLTKEITEAMAMIYAVRKMILDNPYTYNILDLCAGNALSSVLSAFLLPVTYCNAIDKEERIRRWESVDRFTYVSGLNIHEPEVFSFINKYTIIISCHPCKNLADRVVHIYNNSPAVGLVLMPCCNNTQLTMENMSGNKLLQDRLSKYEQWCMYLYEWVRPKHQKHIKMYRDVNCTSSKNIIISDVG